jgi:soluble lytic murein transglycosylase-like protein
MEDKSLIKRFLKDYSHLWFAVAMVFVIFALCLRESKVAFQPVIESQVSCKIEIPKPLQNANFCPISAPDLWNARHIPLGLDSSGTKLSEYLIAFLDFEQNKPFFKGFIPYYVKRSVHKFHPIILEAADQYQIEAALIKAIIMAESGYNPWAISKKGAIGLMQLMPRTAESLGVEDIFDPEHNINAGVKYYKQLLAKFKGDVKLALAAYNAGAKNVLKYQGIPPFKTTQYYVIKVFEYYQYYKMDMVERIDNV